MFELFLNISFFLFMIFILQLMWRLIVFLKAKTLLVKMQQYHIERKLKEERQASLENKI